MSTERPEKQRMLSELESWIKNSLRGFIDDLEKELEDSRDFNKQRDQVMCTDVYRTGVVDGWKLKSAADINPGAIVSTNPVQQAYLATIEVMMKWHMQFAKVVHHAHHGAVVRYR